MREDNFEEDNFEEDNFEDEELYEEYLYFEYKDKWELSKKQLKEQDKEIKRLNNIIAELENRDNVLEEFEDWLERQKTRNSEWDNFIMVDCILGIPISYLLNKLQELKKEVGDVQ